MCISEGEEIEKQEQDVDIAALTSVFHCPHCNKEFQHKSSFCRHNASKCGSLKEFKCTKCDKKFDRKDSLGRHITKGCKGKYKKKHICPTCNREFPHKWHLQRHISTCSLKCQTSHQKIHSITDHVCTLLKVKLQVKKPKQNSNKCSSNSTGSSNQQEGNSFEIPSELWGHVDLAMIYQIKPHDLETNEDDSDVDFNINSQVPGPSHVQLRFCLF